MFATPLSDMEGTCEGLPEWPPEGKGPSWEASDTRDPSRPCIRFPGPAGCPGPTSNVPRHPTSCPPMCCTPDAPGPQWCSGVGCGDCASDGCDEAAAGVSSPLWEARGLAREPLDQREQPGQVGGIEWLGPPEPPPSFSRHRPSSAPGRQQPYVGRGAVCAALRPPGPGLPGPVTADFSCLSGRLASERGLQSLCMAPVCPSWLSTGT